jgi:hypothetical protein
MNNLFIICLLVRFFLAYIAKTFTSILNYMAVIAILISVGFSVIYLFDLRPTGIEANGRIWWNNFRPLHAIMYATFAYLAIYNKDQAWLPLLVDAILGTAIFAARYNGLIQ